MQKNILTYTQKYLGIFGKDIQRHSLWNTHGHSRIYGHSWTFRTLRTTHGYSRTLKNTHELLGTPKHTKGHLVTLMDTQKYLQVVHRYWKLRF